MAFAVREFGGSADDTGDEAVRLSVVIPLYNETDNVDPAVEEVLGVLDHLSDSAELILVDDGSRDESGEKANRWQRRDPRVRVIELRRNFGQTAAISAGLDHARGQVIVLMDGDQQNDPADIPRLLEFIDQGYDVVSGWRTNRQDKLLTRKLPSRMANRLISSITGTRLHDYGCTLKAYDADVVRRLRLYGELHRFIPALASMSGAKVIEVPVNHRARTRGTSKYGISRTFRVILDLVTVKFLLSYLARPMQFFGRIGLLSFAAAMLSAALIPMQHLFAFHLLKGETYMSLAVLLTVLAALFLCVGLLGEMITRVYHEGGSRSSYVIRRSAGFGSPPRAKETTGVVDIRG
jgi:glycosyltransferase involved in cell wall biosynthesis